jgi:prophage antirepressor-like protein
VKEHLFYAVRNVTRKTREELILEIVEKHAEQRLKRMNKEHEEEKKEISVEEKKGKESILVNNNENDTLKKFTDFIKTRFESIFHIKKENKIWWYGNEIAKLFEYKNYKNVISNLNCTKMTFEELNDAIIPEESTPTKLQNNTIFIEKRGIFQLVLNSEMPLAIKFQDILIDDIIPSILMNGVYVSPTATNEQLKTLQQQLINEQREKEQLQLQLQQRPKLDIVFQNRILNIQRKKEYIYILTSIMYAREKLFKIGLSDDVTKRIKSLNTTNITNDQQMYICDVFLCYNAKKVESFLLSLLDQYRYNKDREFVVFNYHSLKHLVTSCCDDNQKNHALFDAIIKKEQMQITEAYIPPPRCVPLPLINDNQHHKNKITHYFKT